MCKAKKPKVAAQEDPQVTQARIQAEAQAKVNSKEADRKRTNRGSLISTGAGFINQESTTSGKTTFGA